MTDSRKQAVQYYSDGPKEQGKPITSIDELKKEIKSRLGSVGPQLKKLCIYRVPNKLRMVKAEAYTPRIVSIGPLHQVNPELVAMEEHKLRYVLYFIQHAPGDQQPQKCLDDCANALYELADSVRKYYGEEIKLNRNALTTVMLLDGCFILELFLRYDQWHSSNQKPEGPDPIFNNAWMIPALRHDLALLENQIPFFILEKLYCIMKPHVDNEHSVISLALNFFRPMCQQVLFTREDRSPELKDCDHLLLFHKLYFLPNHHQVKNGTGDVDLSINLLTNPTSQSQNVSAVETTSRPLPTSRCTHVTDPAPSASHLNIGFNQGASKLLEKGVEFEKGSTNDHLLNITFNKGVLKIPQIFVEETTDSLFRNLIAFEQCHLKTLHQFSSYALLMKSLIRSEEDIKLLQKKQIIITNWIGDERLINFDHILVHVHVHPKDFYFGELCQQVNDYRKLRFRRKVKSLYQTYFSTAWSMVAFIAAVLAFILTAIQTYFSVFPRH